MKAYKSGDEVTVQVRLTYKQANMLNLLTRALGGPDLRHPMWVAALGEREEVRKRG